MAATALGMPIAPPVLDSLLRQLLAGGLNHVPIGGLVAAMAGLSGQGVRLSKRFLTAMAQARARGVHCFCCFMFGRLGLRAWAVVARAP